MTKPFEIATKALCCKQDIPEVEAIRRILFAPLNGALKELGRETLERINGKLDALETTAGSPDVDILAESRTKGKTLRQLMASILLAFESAQTAFLPVSVENLISQAADRLLDVGADEIGVPRNYKGRGIVQAGLVAQLRTMILHLITARRVEVEQAVRSFITKVPPRTSRSSLELTGLPPSDEPRSREEFEELLALNLLASDTDAIQGVGNRVDKTLEIWAYAAFVTAEVESAQAANLEVIVAVAVIDGGTTAFCKWVNGRVISKSRVRRQIEAERDAALAGDGEKLLKVRPFLDPKTARSGTARQFRAFFSRAGIPPYHLGCRTIIRVVRKI